MSLRGLLHERWRTRVTLLASGCLEGPERERTLAHLEACPTCRREHDEVRALVAAVAQDPARTAEPPVALPFLVTRVEAHLDAVVRSRPWRWGWLAAGIAIGLLAAPIAVRLVERQRAAEAPPAPAIAMDEAALRRLERVLAREQAVRYLAEAENVLVNLKAHPRPCPSEHAHVELEEEVLRSRELVARRALLVDLEGDALMPARDVLVDVDNVLREVAALQSCSRRDELERLRREMDERRLLMKVRLLSRELLS
ncbi:MAG TPA: hypothetical protein VFM88_03075 [Vicinamibacteria bacterium]|nr:hypothetical protein [Vicinamibacteria bacterium]